MKNHTIEEYNMAILTAKNFITFLKHAHGDVPEIQETEELIREMQHKRSAIKAVRKQRCR